MDCHKGRQINWRQPKSRTPLARLGDKCIATRQNKWIGDCRRPGHHQPSWIETGRKPDATSQTGRQMNCHKREANNLDIAKAGHHQPHGDRDAQRAEHHQPDWETNGLPQGETHELETAKAGHHQPDWETNESVYGETNELETAERPDTTSQTGKQMSCHKGKQMTWRQPESRTPPARLGDKSIATREDKWIGDSRQHRKPDTTSQTGRQMNCHKPETNELETESRTPPARLGDKWSVTRGDKWIGASRKAGHHQPDWETNESLGRHKRHQPDLETNELETAKEPDITSVTETAEEPDTTSQTGRQMSCHKARQMNWRQPKPDTTSQIGRQMSCHKGRQMNWRQPKPDTTSQIGRQMSCHKGKHMNWRQPESWTPPARLGDKWIATRGQMNSGHPESQTPPSENSRTPLERELRTPTVNCLGTDGRHRAQGGGHSPWHKADTS